MEWVETTGRTVEEAKARALDQLGVAEDDAEFELLDEPRAGLFGRLRGEARVRARVRPTQPRPKQDRRDRRKGRGTAAETDASSGSPATDVGASAATALLDDDPTDSGESDRSAPSKASSGKRRRGHGGAGKNGSGANGSTNGAGDNDASNNDTSKDDRATARGDRSAGQAVNGSEQKENPVDAQQVGDEAQKFVQGLVDAFGLTGTASLRRDGDDLEVVVDGSDLGLLVGPRGTTLQAIQELTRVAAQRRLGDHDTRLRVDVGGYRVRRREALTRFALDQAAAVASEGKARILEPMSSADRKVIHDTLVEFDGVETRSEGDDPNRRVVIAPSRA